MFASPLGLLIGLSLGALGGGGSILAVPVLVSVAGQTPQQATATSLVVVGLAAVIGLVDHHRAQRVQWPIGLVFIGTGIAGSAIGTMVNHRLDGDVLLVAFSLLMLVVAGRMLHNARAARRRGTDVSAAADVPLCAEPDSCAAAITTALSRTPAAIGGASRGADPGTGTGTGTGATRADRPPMVIEDAGWRDHPLWRSRRCMARLVAAGSVVGFLTGLFGVGGGFVIVPALTLGLDMTMAGAVGTSLLIIVGNAVVALALRGIGAVDWSVAAPFAVAAGIGVLLGSRLAGRLPAATAAAAFAVLTIVIALATGGEAMAALLG